MSINLENGLWQCFKSGQTGNFIKLYSILENIPYFKAYERFAIEMFLHEEPVEEEVAIKNTDLGDTSKFIPLDIEKSDISDPVHSQACLYILERGLDGFKFFLCKEGFYKDRIIIPFINSRNEMFYFQARSLNNANPKYLNCKSIKSNHMIYPYDYDYTGRLYITEGVIDCLTIAKLKHNATSTLSCDVSNEQLQQLKYYNGTLVVAFDNDKAGRKGISRFLSMANKFKIPDLEYVIPPDPYKDWNEFLLSTNPKLVSKVLNKPRKLTRLNIEAEFLFNNKLEQV